MGKYNVCLYLEAHYNYMFKVLYRTNKTKNFYILNTYKGIMAIAHIRCVTWSLKIFLILCMFL